MRHNKRRNTAFLYEALIKELTKATVENESYKKSLILKALKKYFNKGSVLRKELELYNEITNIQELQQGEARRLLEAVKVQYEKINRDKAYSLQSKLIQVINKRVSPQVFSHYVPNYKHLATLYQIFSPETKLKDKVLLERKIVKYMTLPSKTRVDTFKVSSTTLKIFSEKFNKAYGNLHKEQRDLLAKYVSSFQDNGLELKAFLNEEIGRLKEEIASIKESSNLKGDLDLIKKSKKVLEVIESFSGQLISEEMLRKVLKIQELAREIKSDE
tara:strand:- start:3191 stop:4006 length:816 start_codon:yes stop_codon:yes gene_type:complete